MEPYRVNEDFGALWNLHGALWNAMERFGALWTPMEPYGALWSPMEPLEPYGAL